MALTFSSTQSSSESLISIFFPRNPLHDGGVIIQGNKITSAGAIFPISLNGKINKKLGTRHRAALGISEESDAVAIVVSEETGKISVAIGGVYVYREKAEQQSYDIMAESASGALENYLMKHPSVSKIKVKKLSTFKF